MTSQARKGRYFPMATSAVVASIRTAGLVNVDGHPLPISVANPKPAQERESLAGELKPHRGLTLFSVPLAVEPANGLLLWQQIIDACIRLRGRREPVRSGQGPVYAFLDGLGEARFRIVARWYHFQTRKYRGRDKFTGGLTGSCSESTSTPFLCQP